MKAHGVGTDPIVAEAFIVWIYPDSLIHLREDITTEGAGKTVDSLALENSSCAVLSPHFHRRACIWSTSYRSSPYHCLLPLSLAIL